MTQLVEGKLTFTFSNIANVCKYDDWSFYRNQFQSVGGSSKAVDFINIEGAHIWLIEVKDYRKHHRTKAIDLGSEVALKVKDTLAGLVAAQCNATDNVEKEFSKKAIRSKYIHIVLHLEQAQKVSRLFPQAIDPSKLMIKLKQQLKAIDAHPKVVDRHSVNQEMSWTVACSP